jgi:hypothetical protein
MIFSFILLQTVDSDLSVLIRTVKNEMASYCHCYKVVCSYFYLPKYLFYDFLWHFNL